MEAKMKNVIPLVTPATEKEQDFKQKARIIKFPEIHKIRPRQKSAHKSSQVKITAHYLYYRGQKIPISRFEKAGYGKLLRLLVKEIF